MSFLRIARASAAPLLFVAVALPASADWDQKRVIELASQLEKTIGLGIKSAETARQQRTVMQQRTRDAAVVAMKQAHDFSREYAAKIRGGWSQGDSEPFFNQLRRATRRARETARDAVPDPNVAPHLERMDALLIDLSKQYERD